MARHHRSAAYKNSRQIKAGCRHQHTGNNFIAVRNHNKGIKLMSLCHTFNGISNEFACYKRIFHSLMAHCNTVTDTNCRKFYWSSAGHTHARLYSFGNSVKFNMARNYFIFCTTNTNKRALQFFISKTHCIEQ